MGVVAVNDDPRVVVKILRDRGVWHDRTAELAPPDAAGPYTYEPCSDVETTPDYEVALTH